MIKPKLLKSKKGMTLVEVVVSLAILSILAVFIMAVFGSSFQTVVTNANLKKGQKDAAAGIENKLAGFDPDGNLSVTNEQSGNFSIDFGGVTIDASGNFIIGKNKDQDSTYYFFIPD
ncbi:MAG TPA: hypothetical protein DEP23_09005 [Ruminococcaceae bacterium]|nr:hypothetical protein [Oscillospiraceae bacterium]